MISPQQALKTLGRRPSKSLGQHFLINQATAGKNSGRNSVPSLEMWWWKSVSGLGALDRTLEQEWRPGDCS